MSDDLIRRSDAIKACIDIINTRNDERVGIKGGTTPPEEKTIKIIYEMVPSYEPKRGEWIIRDDNAYCSECGASEDTFIYGSEYWHGLGLSHYCPNCGAKMKVVK